MNLQMMDTLTNSPRQDGSHSARMMIQPEDYSNEGTMRENSAVNFDLSSSHRSQNSHRGGNIAINVEPCNIRKSS